MKSIDLLIVGGGPAGLAAAIGAYEQGVRDILILDRNDNLGGILQQCIHNGFGLHKFKEELTGPEYSFKYEQQILNLKIPFRLNTMVTNITKDKIVTATNEMDGLFQLKAKVIILAMGCRERSRGALNIPGSRPSGIYTAGTAQRYVNIKGYLPGKEVVILGSGDIGLIMARRMTLEGAKVKAVCELLPYSGGLTRNIVQCLDDFDIPLMLRHTITEIHGKERVTGVTIAQVDENKAPIAGTETEISCDTILLSVGLLPENELTKMAGVILDPITGGAVVNERRETSVSGIFACGNVLHVHDLVDFVSEEAALAGKGAAQYLQSSLASKVSASSKEKIHVKPIQNVRYVIPQVINKTRENIKLFFRVANVYKNVIIEVKDGENVLLSQKKAKVAPGEMESLLLSPTLLKKIQSGCITIGLTPQSENA